MILPAIFYQTVMHSSRMHTVHCSDRRGCLPGGVSAQWGSAGVVSAQGDVCLGRCVPRGVYPSMHLGRHPSPVDRVTDRGKNITLPQLRCGR